MYTAEDFKNFIRLNADEKYKAFISKLVNTSYALNGVRMPLMKKEAKFIAKNCDVKDFFAWDTVCYEQVAVQGYVLSYIAKSAEFKELLENYIGKIDDWSLCDGACCAIKRKDDEYFALCKSYASSPDEWRARWGIVGIMVNFLDKDEETLLSMLKSIEQGKYYVDMALAWLLQVLAAKYEDKATNAIMTLNLSPAVRKMTAGKIRDSLRISKEKKDFFNNLLKTIK